MININKIKTSNDPYKREILMLNDFLTKKKGIIKVFNKTLPKPISVNTKILEFASLCNVSEMITSAIDERRGVSPKWYFSLKAWVAEIKEQLRFFSLDYPPVVTNGSGVLSNEEIIFRRVFIEITHGNNDALWTVAHLFIDFNYNTEKEEVCEKYFDQVPRAIYYAYLLPKLIQELEMLEDFETNPKTDKIKVVNKIRWIGSPGEFGYIIDLLIEKGYLDDIFGVKKKSEFFLRFFTVKTSKGEAASARYIQDCFGKNKKSFASGEVKLPPSDFITN